MRIRKNTSKELAQAKAIVEKRGVEKAQCVVAYHYDKAQETTYTPQLFGDFLHDVETAMQSWTAQEQKRWQQKLES